MTTHIRPALVLLALMTVLTGLAYPLAVTGLAQLLFPTQSNGSILVRDGKPVGSLLIGQNITDPRLFHPRPSATTPAPYNPQSSGGSNLSPTSKTLTDRITADAATLRTENPTTPIPADLLTTSASGLDPHISPAAARFQIPRIAKARGIPESTLQALIDANTESPLAGLLGEPRVNVLALNLALPR
jgi:K+-transporting ATPase ATPase C chain